MRAVETHRLGAIADYDIVERQVPTPNDGEVLIRVATCGMGYVDALLALGRYQVKPTVPFTPGVEVGGTIVAIGADVHDLCVGDRVMAQSFGGGLAEFVSLPADAALAIPDNMSFAHAAIFRVNYLTALHALLDRAELSAGERLLVLGSAGGVGTAAVQLGSLLGADVTAVASSPAKRDFALANGAAQAMDTQPEGWRERLKVLTHGSGPDVVFDPVCGPLFELAFRSLAWRGRHLVVGFAGGPVPALPVNLPLMKGAALTGVDVRQFQLFEPERARAHLVRLLEWIGAGKLTPPVGRSFPFSHYGEAIEFALSGQATGKTVIEVGFPD